MKKKPKKKSKISFVEAMKQAMEQAHAEMRLEIYKKLLFVPSKAKKRVKRKKK